MLEQKPRALIYGADHAFDVRAPKAVQRTRISNFEYEQGTKQESDKKRGTPKHIVIIRSRKTRG